MEDVMLLTLMATFTLVAGICSIVFNRLKMPPLIGYLVAGIVIANVFTMTSDWEFVISMLSSIGLVMLMFSIGMEIDISNVRSRGIFAIKIAMIQLPLLVIGGMIIGPMLGFNMVQSIALGAIISGSSTAVVLAVLKSQARLDPDHIELIILITVMEDIGQVIILSIITPILAGSSMNLNSLIVMIISIVIFMVVSLFIGLKFMPRIIDWISKSVPTEVLVIFSVGLAFGMALLSIKVGLSMAIGAFLMGLMISPCKSSKEITQQIEPMKNLFMAMFFISVGMEVKVEVITQCIWLILAIYIIYAVLKTTTVAFGYWVCNTDGKTGFLSAISLVAMGEFAFIIAKEAYNYGVVSQYFYTSVVGAALLSMIVLPLLTRYSEKMWDTGVRLCPNFLRNGVNRLDAGRDHIYKQINISSKMSQDAFHKGINHAYFDILLIAFLQIAFYWLIPVASDWLFDAFGVSLLMWQFVLVISNILVLIPPAAYLIKSTKFLSGIIISSSEYEYNADLKSGKKTIYQSVLEVNTLLVALAISFMIVFIVPNPLGVVEHFLCLVIALVLVSLAYIMYRRKSKSGTKKTKTGKGKGYQDPIPVTTVASGEDDPSEGSETKTVDDGGEKPKKENDDDDSLL